MDARARYEPTMIGSGIGSNPYSPVFRKVHEDDAKIMMQVGANTIRVNDLSLSRFRQHNKREQLFDTMHSHGICTILSLPLVDGSIFLTGQNINARAETKVLFKNFVEENVEKSGLLAWGLLDPTLTYGLTRNPEVALQILNFLKMSAGVVRTSEIKSIGSNHTRYRSNHTISHQICLPVFLIDFYEVEVVNRFDTIDFDFWIVNLKGVSVRDIATLFDVFVASNSTKPVVFQFSSSAWSFDDMTEDANTQAIHLASVLAVLVELEQKHEKRFGSFGYLYEELSDDWAIDPISQGYCSSKDAANPYVHHGCLQIWHTNQGAGNDAVTFVSMGFNGLVSVFDTLLRHCYRFRMNSTRTLGTFFGVNKSGLNNLNEVQCHSGRTLIRVTSSGALLLLHYGLIGMAIVAIMIWALWLLIQRCRSLPAGPESYEELGTPPATGGEGAHPLLQDDVDFVPAQCANIKDAIHCAVYVSATSTSCANGGGGVNASTTRCKQGSLEYRDAMITLLGQHVG
jgi:hypothetical protein